jgi:hypothetical protein
MTRHIRRAGRLAAAAILAVAVAGCMDANGPSAAPTAKATPEPTPVAVTYVIGDQVWYEGLILTFDRANAVLDERGGTVDLLVGLQNPGEEAHDLDGPITLLVGDVRVEPTRDSHLPEVPAGGSAATILTFEFQAIASAADAIIEVGKAPLHVARVPMTPAAGPLVAYEPVTFALKGAATASTLRVSLTGGLLRWDLPDWQEELDAKLQALTLTYDVTYTGDFSGGQAFTGENVALKLPDGTVISARTDGRSQSVELIGAHKTKKGLSSRFEIPAGMTGTFALLVRLGSVQKSITFAIGG